MRRRDFMKSAALGAGLLGLAPASVLARDGMVPLPVPEPADGEGLMDALARRRSTRAFGPGAIPPELTAGLLWAAFGVNRPESGKRTAPSAYDNREIDLYAATAEGLFLYHPDAHALQKLQDRDIRALTGVQAFAASAPLNVVYVADEERMAKVPPGDRERLFHADCGFIAQNAYLFCAVSGLACVVRDWIDRSALAKAMDLKQSQRVVMAQSVGFPG